MIYHYTKVMHLPPILAQGLKPTNVFIAPGEKPVLWFSTNPQWENTVFCSDAPSLKEAHLRMRSMGGLARIGCHDSVAPHRWKELKELANIPSKFAMSLYQAAIAVQSRPGEWRGTFSVVPVKQFKTIEVFDGVNWVSIFQVTFKAA